VRGARDYVATSTYICTERIPLRDTVDAALFEDNRGEKNASPDLPSRFISFHFTIIIRFFIFLT